MMPIDITSNAPVETQILNLHAKILMGKVIEGEIEQVTKLAKENNCLDVLRRELKSTTRALINSTVKG